MYMCMCTLKYIKTILIVFTELLCKHDSNPPATRASTKPPLCHCWQNIVQYIDTEILAFDYRTEIKCGYLKSKVNMSMKKCNLGKRRASVKTVFMCMNYV